MSNPNPCRKKTGTDGETIARSHLEHLGWHIVATNFRCPQGEIDLIAEEPSPDGPTLVFLEVKTRRGTAQGMPREAVDSRKQQRLFAVAQVYLAQRAAGGDEPACRFDIAEVFTGPDGLSRVVLWRGAFSSE